jgi:uncharacterized repeat protein (TIGR02543 family)
MVLSLMVGIAQATNEAPFKLVATVSSDKKTVTIALVTDSELSYGNFDMTLTCPQGFTLAENYTQGADFSDFKTNGITYNNATGVTSLNTTAGNSNITVAENKTLMIYTATVPEDVAYGEYTFSANFTAAADYSGTALSWKGTTITSNAVTLGTHTHTYGNPVWSWTGNDTNGYTAATATWTCTAENCDNSESKTVTKTATLSAVAANADASATCEKTGIGTVTATISASDSPTGQEVTAKQTNVTVPMGKHDLTETKEVPANCYQAGKKAYWTCSVCRNVFADENGTKQLTGGADDASLTIAATGNHSYDSEGKCTTEGCDAVAPDFTAYYELWSSDGTTQLITDADNLNGIDVTAGSTYIVKVFLKAGSTSNNKLTAYELNLTYPSDKMTVVNDTTVKTYDKVNPTTGAITYSKYTTTNTTAGSTYETIDTTGTQVAQFKITLNVELDPATLMELGFSATAKNTISTYDQPTVQVAVSKETLKIGTLSQVAVKWNLNGGSINNSTDTIETKVTYGQSATKPESDPTKAAYNFEGWYLATDTNEAVITNFPNLTADTEYKAKWSAKSYTIIYGDLDGGKLNDSTTPANGSYTTEDESLPTPTKAGYTFAGWLITAVDTRSEASDLTASDETTYTSLKGRYGNVTLKATWTINATAVTANYDYAEGSMNGFMLIVSALPEEGQTVLYNGTPLYYVAQADASSYTAKFTGTDNTPAVMGGAEGVYVTLITGTYEASKLTIAEGTSETLTFSNDINGDNDVDAFDASIVYQLLNNRTNLTENQVSIKIRLLADIDHSFTANAEDLNTIANAIPGVTGTEDAGASQESNPGEETV